MKIKLTPFQWAAELLSLLAVVGQGIYLLIIWSGLPEQIPSHFGADGAPDAWSGRPMLLVFWGISLGLYLLFSAVEWLPRFWNLPETLSEKSRPLFFSITCSLLVSIKLIVSLAFGWIIIATANSRSLGAVFILLLIGALLLSMATYFVRSFRLSLADARGRLQKETE